MINRGMAVGMAMLLVALAAGRATAGEPDPCAGIDGHWRVAGHDPAHTTSRCVGDPKSPVCALDTYMVGTTRENLKLSRRTAPDSMIALIKYRKFWKGTDSHYQPMHNNMDRSYRIVGCRVMTTNDSPVGRWGTVWPGVKKDHDHAWYPGDIRLDVHEVWCSRDREACAGDREEPDAVTYVVRRLNFRRWRLVDWEISHIFPLQGHVGEPCLPEDGAWHVLNGITVAITECSENGGPPLCEEEAAMAGKLEDIRKRTHNPQLFIRYKVIDCERYGVDFPLRGAWDPRPMIYPSRIGGEKLEKYWEPGDARLGIRMQLCSATDNSCKAPIETLSFSSHEYGNWGGIKRVPREASGSLE